MKILLFSIITLLVGLFACTYSEPVKPAPGVVVNEINYIAIIPFKYSATVDKTEVPGDFIDSFNNELYSRLTTGLNGVSVVGQTLSADALNSIKSEPGMKEFIPEFCKLTHCDAVLTGEIKYYGERVGGEYGVHNPASFAFVTKLHDGKTGNILWEDYYYEKQKPLLENVAEVGKFFKRKGRWVSTQEIAYEGIDQLVIKLNDLLKR